MCQNSRQFTHLLNTCTSLSFLNRIHSLLIVRGLSRHLTISTKLLSIAASLSPSVHYARRLFDEIPDSNRDSYLYNTLLRAYSDSGPLGQIFPLYSQMHRLGLPPDRFTFPFVLRSSAVLSGLNEGKQAHCNAIKHGLDSDVFAATSLVLLYSSCGKIPDMELVYRDCGVRNIVLWTAVIAGYVQNSVFAKGMDAFRWMMAGENVRPNEVTIVSVLPACAGPVWVDCGRSVHGFAIKEGLDSFASLVNALIAMYGKCGDLDAACYLFDGRSDRTLVTWNTMIAVFEQGGHEAKAIELFRRLIESDEDEKFNAVTLVSVLAACARLGALDIGKWMHELATSRGIETDVRVGNALIDMYSKCGRLDLAQDAFRKTELKGVVSWSAMIGAYATHGQAHKALELFDKMRANGVRPNSFTYTSVLSACSHSGLVDDGMRHYNSMREEYGIVPKVEHCACVVDLLGRAGRLNEAHEFVKGMELKPDTGVWGALLGACRIHGNVEMAELVAADIFKVEPHNVTFCVLMLNIYADAGRWKDVARIRRLMKKKELRKMPGCSSIET